MVECNFLDTHNIYPNLNEQQQFRLNKINETKDYFVAEIKGHIRYKTIFCHKAAVQA